MTVVYYNLPGNRHSSGQSDLTDIRKKQVAVILGFGVALNR